MSRPTGIKIKDLYPDELEYVQKNKGKDDTAFIRARTGKRRQWATSIYSGESTDIETFKALYEEIRSRKNGRNAQDSGLYEAFTRLTNTSLFKIYCLSHKKTSKSALIKNYVKFLATEPIIINAKIDNVQTTRRQLLKKITQLTQENLKYILALEKYGIKLD